ncbi:MAG: prephenate dehydrogenase/arogenate dehydrogenase family protein [Acidobacteria bacterium]|nr:prephenate dehydrogenase/arogenate dehydrogenase family protein [Acidobacteriota bacterium]
MRTLAIVGTGLLGSSFGLAAKRVGHFDRILGVSSEAVVSKALSIGAIEEAMALEQALPLADVVLLAQPVLRIISLLETINPLLKTGALVTDVGSTKVAISNAAKHIARGRFVGGHPMAGREVRGPEGASADLFVGRPWVLTMAEPELVSLVEKFGSRPFILDAEQHDLLVAHSSHLPQLLSTALASYLGERELRHVAGPGLHDMTRLALSSHELWADILDTNASNIDGALAGLIEELEAMRDALAKGRLAKHFEQGAVMAKRLRSI